MALTLAVSGVQGILIDLNNQHQMVTAAGAIQPLQPRIRKPAGINSFAKRTLFCPFAREKFSHAGAMPSLRLSPDKCR